VKKLLAMLTIIQVAAVTHASAFEAEVARRTANGASGWKVCKDYNGPRVACFVTNAPSQNSYQAMSAVYNAVTISANAAKQQALINVSDHDLGRDFTRSALGAFLKELGIATAAERVADFDASVAATRKAQAVSGYAVPGTKFGRNSKVTRFVKDYTDGRMTYACGYSGFLEMRTGQNCAIVIEGAK